jgi:membrane-associated phospholipid phosphatase
VSVALLAGCATLPDGQRWGEDARVPRWQRAGTAAWQAVKNPTFWAPLLAAGALQVGGADHRASAWARRNTPIFGSEANAAHWSDDLRSASVVVDWATVLLAPSGPIDGDWLQDKAQGAAVDLAAAESAIEFTAGLERLTRRERPNGAGDTSMPSDHTTTSAVYTSLAAQNLEMSGLEPAAQEVADLSLGALTVATGWARVEAGYHYPSDTLVGASIGSFFGHFFTTAFLKPEDRSAASLHLGALPGGAALVLQLKF